MRHRIRSHLTYANVMATLAVFLVLGGGTALASYVISSNSQVGPGTISGHKPPTGDHANVIAGSVNGQDVADNSLHGADIAESTLGKVPSAAKANDAFSTFHDGQLDLPDSIGAPTNPIADLSIPHAGNYVVTATLEAFDSALSAHGGGFCILSVGGDSDRKGFTLDPDYPESLTLQAVHTFNGGGLATLSCSDAGSGPMVAEYIKITAVQVNNLTNSGF
jgi:hypothetical protein